MSNNYENINFAIEDRVARITLSRPPLNVLNISMMQQINRVLEKCSARRDLVAILFEASADSRAFSAGVAVEEHVEATIYRMLEAFHAIFRGLNQLAIPTVAMVDGPALGGGCELVAACDIVVASERARFGQPEIKLGVFPPVAAVMLPRIIGEKRARELILTGEMIEPNDALSFGLVNHVVSPSQLRAKTEEILGKLRELSSVALEMTRRALDLGRGQSIDSLLRVVEDLYLHELMKTEDALEGVAAFTAKRKPEWRNR
jgi:cyclohexa-1,5-dienecarbonyl-CoA hydratase